MISIIIPAYNATETIQHCLDGVFNQTNQDFEVIIVNDGSTDDLLLALSNCRRKLTILNQENKGAPAARNYGFKFSCGDYVLFLDADIVMKPMMLEKMLAALAADKSADFAYSSFRWGWKKFKLWPFDPLRLKQEPYIHTSSLIRRRAFPDFDEKLKKFQDWDLFLTITEKGGRGIYIPEILFKVTTGGTMSSWLPKFIYKLPWLKLRSKDRYEQTAAIIRKKHNLMPCD